MFCANCGSEMPNDAKFCEKCGTKVEVESVQASTAAPSAVPPSAVPPSVAAPGAAPQPLMQGKPINRKMVFAVAAVVVVLLIGSMIIKNRKVRVELDDYVTVEFSGYDSKGTARVDFDSDAFSRDYKNKIEYQGADLKKVEDYVSAAEMLRYACVSGELSEDSGLKNGDVITFTWNCDDEAAAEDFKAKLVYKDLDFTVSDLDEVELADPFENLEVTFDGFSGDARAYVNNHSSKEHISTLHFRVSPDSGLSNGDEVTVTVDDNWNEEYYVERYGITLSQLEKTYTVEGLNTYLSSMEDLDDSALAAMKSQGEDVIRAYVANRWDEHESLDRITYIGSYLLTAKDISKYNKNMYYLVYQIDASDNYDEQGIHNPFSFYYSIRYDNIVLTGDGDAVYDLNNYSKPNQTFHRKVQYGEQTYEHANFSYDGYEDMKTTLNQCVTVNLDSYSYETDITE